MRENIEILNLPYQKEENLFGARSKLSYYKVFQKKLLAIEMNKI